MLCTFNSLFSDLFFYLLVFLQFVIGCQYLVFQFGNFFRVGGQFCLQLLYKLFLVLQLPTEFFLAFHFPGKLQRLITIPLFSEKTLNDLIDAQSCWQFLLVWTQNVKNSHGCLSTRNISQNTIQIVDVCDVFHPATSKNIRSFEVNPRFNT